jgi:hypothetical protein
MLLHRHWVCRRHALHLRLLPTGSLLHRGCLPTGSLLHRGCLPIGSTLLRREIQVCYVGAVDSPVLPSRATARKVDLLELNARVVRTDIDLTHAAFDDSIGRLMQCHYDYFTLELRHGVGCSCRCIVGGEVR